MSETRSALLPAALDVFASTPATLRALLGGIPEGVASTPGDEGWSAKDIVAHLVSLHGPTLIDRITPILERDEPPIANVDEAAILESSGLRGKPLAELLDRLERNRREAVAWLGGLSGEQLRRAGVHSSVGRVTVADLIHHKAWHDLLHIQQACRLIAAPLDGRRGAMRVFR
jgi:hypothetical protein